MEVDHKNQLIYFDEDTEQRFADLPASMPLSMAQGMAHHLLLAAEVIEASGAAEAEARQTVDWRSLGYDSFEEMLEVTGWQVTSLRAYWRYTVGRQLAELTAPLISDSFERYLRDQE